MTNSVEKYSFDKFVYLRDEIRGHHEMVNHRMSWFAATQSLLYGAYVPLMESKKVGWPGVWLIPMVGILLCMLMVPAVESAFERVRALRKVLKKFTHEFGWIYPINKDLWHDAAQLYPRFVPWIFLLSWCLLLWFGWKNS